MADMILDIQEGSFHTLLSNIKRANKRAARYGLTGGWEVVGHEICDGVMTRNGVYNMIRVKLKGINYVNPNSDVEIAGYKKIEGDAVDVIVINGDREEIIQREDTYCDHCGPDNRHRSLLAIIRHEGRLMQLGTSCVERYVGFNFGGVQFIDFFKEENLTRGVKMIDSQIHLDPMEFVNVICQDLLDNDLAYARHSYNFLREKAVDCPPEIVGVKNYLMDCFSEFSRGGYYGQRVDCDSNQAYNALVALTDGVATFGTAMAIAAVASEVLRDEDSPLQNSMPPVQFIGEVGERIEFEGEITSVKAIEGQYGVTMLVKGVDSNGAGWSTFNSGKFGKSANEGDVVKIRATVKAHSKQWRETNLTRVVLV